MPRNDAGTSSGSARDEAEAAAAAAVAETFAKRSRREQMLFDEAASASSQQRKAAFGREELRPPEEYLAVNWPMAGFQLYGPELMRDLEETARGAGVEARCRGRGARHPSRIEEELETRCPRLVLLGPRGKALEVALEFVKAAERILGAKKLRRARRYLTAAAGDELIAEPDQHVEPDSASSCSEDAGGSAPDDVQSEADFGGDDDYFSAEEDEAAAAASSSAVGSAAASSAERTFWAACRQALRQASGANAGRMRAAVNDLELQLTSMENGRLDWQPLQPQNLGEPKIAMASHALSRDYQVKVALPLQCMALLRMRNVGHL